MKAILLYLLLTLGCSAQWNRDFQKFYWFNGSPTNGIAGVAISPVHIQNINHAVAGVGAVNIGNTNGPEASYCTAFLPPEHPCGSVQNCSWPITHADSNDIEMLTTCRPMTIGIAYVITNVYTGQPIVWYSNISRQWISGNVIYDGPQSTNNNFGVGTTREGLFIFDGPVAQAGDSGSPVFTLRGEFAGAMSGYSFPGGGITNMVAKYALPPDSRTYPTAPVDNSASFLNYFDPP